MVTHTGEKTHRIIAEWILEEENNVKMSRPKGENFIIFITWLFVKSIDSASRSVMLADGRPFESFKTAQCTAMHEVSTFWKTFRFLEVSEWLVPASSFGFFCPTKVEQEKKKVPHHREETATTLPLLSSVLSLSLSEKTKIVIMINKQMIYFKCNENSVKKLYYLSWFFYLIAFAALEGSSEMSSFFATARVQRLKEMPLVAHWEARREYLEVGWWLPLQKRQPKPRYRSAIFLHHMRLTLGWLQLLSAFPRFYQCRLHLEQ